MQHSLSMALCLLLALSAAAAGTGVRTIPAAAARPKVVAADFVQIRHLRELDMDVESRGSMVCELDGRLRWQIDDPVKSVTVIDRERLTHFDAETGKIAVIEQSNFPWLKVLRESMDDWLSGDGRRLERRFAVTSPRPDTLLLVPRGGELKELCRSVEIVFSPDGGVIRAIRIAECGGDSLDIRFSRVVHDPKPAPGIWQLPPR